MWLPLVPPTGDLAHNPDTCPDWESNQWPFALQASVQSMEPHQPGHILIPSFVADIIHGPLAFLSYFLGFYRGICGGGVLKSYATWPPSKNHLGHWIFIVIIVFLIFTGFKTSFNHILKICLLILEREEGREGKTLMWKKHWLVASYTFPGQKSNP